MIKFCGHIDNLLDGKATPTITDRIILILMVPTILATLIGMVWLAAAVAELYK